MAEGFVDNLRPHRVDRVVFDLRAAGAPLQQRVSRFCRDRLDGLLTAAFDAACADGDCARLEIDLGTIRADVLERELALRLEAKLAAALGKHRTSCVPAPAAAQATQAQAAHWLAQGAESAPAADVLAGLAAAPAAFARLLAEHGRRAAVRRRLAQADEALLAMAVRALEPAHAERILACVDGIAAARLPAPAPAPTPLRRAVWEFVLTYLLLERGTRFNTLSFVGSLLRQMAARFGFAYADLLDLVGREAQQAPFSVRAGLPGVLAELRLAGTPPPPQESVDDLADAALYLEFGVLAHARPHAGGAEGLLVRLLAERPEALADLVRRLGLRESVRQRLAARMPAPFLAALAALLSPVQAPMVARSLHALERLQAAHRLVPADGAAFSRLLWRSLLDLLLGDRGSMFNRRSFLRSALHGLAAAHGMAYETVLLAALAQLPEAGAARSASLAALLLSLSDDVWIGPRAAGAGVATRARRLARLETPRRGRLLGAAALRAGQSADAVDALARGLAAHAGTALAPQALACLWAVLRAGPATPQHLLQATLAAAGIRLGCGYAALLKALAARLAGGPWSAACAVLLAAREQYPAPVTVRPPPGPAEPQQEAMHFLVTGAAGAGDPAALVACLLDDPARAAALLRNADGGPQLYRRLLATAIRPALRRLLGALAGDGAATLLAWLEQGDKSGSAGLAREAARWELALTLLCDRHAGVRPGQALVDELEDRLVHAAAVPFSTPDNGPAALPMAPRGESAGLPALCAFLQYRTGAPAAAAACFDAAWVERRAELAALLRACVRGETQRRGLAAMGMHVQWRSLGLLLGRDAAAAWACLGRLQDFGWDWRTLFAALLAALADAPTRRFDPAALAASIRRRTGRSLAAAQWTDLIGGLDPRDAATPRLRARLSSARRRAVLQPPWTAPAPHTEPVREAQTALPEGLGIHTPVAGVVLLWPFLQHYFQTLGMLHGLSFRDAAARERAVQLIHYLAGAGPGAADEDQVLNKLLCGLDSACPVAPAAPLTEDEAALSQQLLYSATQNWRQLGNTSVAGLRETFLLRSGRLVCRENGWLLTVASGPFDMLLSTLPWGLSHVYLPWMGQPLAVEWKR